ncbi:MAG TPA: diguanylate cyclase [Chloroflexia bacterium]|nr:diguanylate cyclase [Chloroflexia bacterium]
MTRTPSLLDELLQSDYAAIVEHWAQALHSRSNSAYAARPVEELRLTCGACLSAFQQLVGRRDQAPLRRFILESMRLRSPQGFALAEIERAFLTVKAIVRPRLLARYAGCQDVAAYAADWQCFEQAVDIALLRFSEHYQTHQTIDLQRRLAREHKLSAQLAELAVRDELTGLYNYRYFQARLGEEVRRSLRYNRPLALLLGDVDYFKQVNDEYGHATGNRVLQYIARTMEAEMRNTDILARFGGEELAVILTETTAAEALVVAEKVRSTLEAESLEPELPPVTISIGVGVLRPGDVDGSRLVSDADMALYAAKDAGRNRVILAPATAAGDA